MRRDRRSPALYELMGSRGARPATSAPAQATSGSGDSFPRSRDAGEDSTLAGLSPGRTIRVPIGYMFFLVAVVLAVGIGGYAIGYSMSERAHRRQLQDLALGGVGAEPINEPLDQLPVNPGLMGPREAAARTPPPPLPSASGQSTNSPSTGRMVVVGGKTKDPRQTGMNYLIVATLPKSEAEDAAAFLASRGLEIGVIPVDNRPSRWRVVVLQGFGSKDWYGTAGKALEAQVKALGREYQQERKASTNFKDPYWEKYRQ